jgi:hypothetical protein
LLSSAFEIWDTMTKPNIDSSKVFSMEITRSSFPSPIRIMAKISSTRWVSYFYFIFAYNFLFNFYLLYLFLHSHMLHIDRHFSTFLVTNMTIEETPKGGNHLCEKLSDVSVKQRAEIEERKNLTLLDNFRTSRAYFRGIYR